MFFFVAKQKKKFEIIQERLRWWQGAEVSPFPSTDFWIKQSQTNPYHLCIRWALWKEPLEVILKNNISWFKNKNNKWNNDFESFLQINTVAQIHSWYKSH